MRFRDREQAGRLLGERLRSFGGAHPIIFGLPRGGVPVAAEVARALGAPLEVLVARKLGAPGQPELGLGAIAEGGALYLDEEACGWLGVDEEMLSQIAAREAIELERRVQAFRGARPLPDVRGRTAIVIDDGVATGGTARAALRAVRALEPAHLVFATPVAAPQAAADLEAECDEVIALAEPPRLLAIGYFYEDFAQVDDDQVRALLAASPSEQPGAPDAPPATRSRPVRIPVGPLALALDGDLTLPEDARGLVLFAHGAGSSHKSPRNRRVAAQLAASGLATLLFDLLTPAEDEDPERRFELPLLAERLARALDWVDARPELARLPLGLFGSSTGAAAALMLAALRPERVSAVVSRGGRPDLAGPALPRVRAPTLLLCGGRDYTVLALNQEALRELPGEKELVVVPGATHLFEEPGALDEVAARAAAWFLDHLGPHITVEPRP